MINNPGIMTDHEAAVHIASTVIDRTQKQVTEDEELVRRVKEARAALDVLTDTWKSSWLDWLDQSKHILNEFRSWRMAMTAEGKIVTQEFAEVRKFFLSKDHDEEIRRLGEFVSLCERLQALKASGFLEVITETMLKLDE